MDRWFIDGMVHLLGVAMSCLRWSRCGLWLTVTCGPQGLCYLALFWPLLAAGTAAAVLHKYLSTYHTSQHVTVLYNIIWITFLYIVWCAPGLLLLRAGADS